VMGGRWTKGSPCFHLCQKPQLGYVRLSRLQSTQRLFLCIFCGTTTRCHSKVQLCWIGLAFTPVAFFMTNYEIKQTSMRPVILLRFSSCPDQWTSACPPCCFEEHDCIAVQLDPSFSHSFIFRRRRVLYSPTNTSTSDSDN